MKIDKEQKYIVRSVKAGVFYGYIIEKDGCEVAMKIYYADRRDSNYQCLRNTCM